MESLVSRLCQQVDLTARCRQGQQADLTASLQSSQGLCDSIYP